MFAVFETAGYRVRKGYIIEHARAGDYKYLRVTASKNVKRAVKALKILGVLTLIPVNAELPHGFRLPDPSNAVRRAAPVAARQFSKMGQTAAVIAPRASSDAVAVCDAVLPYTRRLMLRCGGDSSLLAFRVLKRYGVAAIAEPSDELLREAGFTAVVGDSEITVNGVTLKSGNIELKNAPPPPDGVPPMLWHNALLESGVFDIGKIRIDNRLTMGYNADSEI